MTTLDIVLLLVAGCASGFLNVIAGGGSLITLPLLLHMGYPAPLANGTNRVAIIVQCLSAVATFRSKGHSDLRTSLRMSALVIPGAIIGGLAGVKISGRLFDILLALVMLGVAALTAAQMWRPPTRHARGTPASRGGWAGALALVGIGFYGGFLQVGVGFLLMATLERLFRMDLLTVNTHKVFLALAFTAAAFPVFVWQGQVNWKAGAILAVGNATGAWASTHLQIRKGEKLIRAVFLGAILLMAADLLFMS